jgi:hypothetical protein
MTLSLTRKISALVDFATFPVLAVTKISPLHPPVRVAAAILNTQAKAPVKKQMECLRRGSHEPGLQPRREIVRRVFAAIPTWGLAVTIRTQQGLLAQMEKRGRQDQKLNVRVRAATPMSHQAKAASTRMLQQRGRSTHVLILGP